MAQLWQGRASKAVDSRVNDFNSSIRFDARMIEQDIQGSMVHSAMLGRQGIISARDVEDIHKGLQGILEDLHSGALEIDPAAEDVHTFVEQTLTARVGDAGKRLHTGRSRNDQVALDLRLNLREASHHLQGQIKELIETLCTQAEKSAGYVMPGYTHLQRAQPVTFGHQLMAYAWMLLRDLGRLQDATGRMDAECPLGSGALAGTTYPLDRFYTAKELGFDAPCANSIDGVSDRDFCIELCAALSTCMMHLSRLSEEVMEEIRRTACRAYRLLGCEGLARVDFFVRNETEVILNELNTLPGFTSISMYPKLWEACGVSCPELLDRFLALAFER